MPEEVNGAGADVPNGTSVAAQQTPGDAPTQQAPKVDLTSLPEFREFQKSIDRRNAQKEAEHQRQLAAMQSQMSEMQSQLSRREAAEMATLDPEERIAAMQRKLDEQASIQRHTNDVMSMLSEAGLTMQDTRLAQALAYGPTPAGVTAVRAAIIRIQREEAEQARQEAQQAKLDAQAALAEARREAEQARAKGRVQGIQETGATVTSNSPGVPAVEEDARAAKLRALRKRFREIRDSGGVAYDDPKIMRLKADARREGISMEEIAPG